MASHAASDLNANVYTRWRATTLGSITEQVEKSTVFNLIGPLSAKRLLDVGTGDGTYAIEAAKRGAVVTALDIQQDMLAAAQMRAQESGVSIELKTSSVESLPFPDASFDVVVAITVLCFLPDPKIALREIARVLAPGGILVLGEFNRFSLWAAERRIRSWFSAKIWQQVHFRSRDALVRLAENAGLRVIATQGSVFFPPIGIAARIMAPLESLFTFLHAPGAAFIALAAKKQEI